MTETSIPVGMLLRKMYCSRCGTQLQRKKVKKTYKRGEPGFRNFTASGRFINFSTYAKAYYIYCCPGCGNELSYYKQTLVDAEQKRQNKLILEEREADTGTNEADNSKR